MNSTTPEAPTTAVAPAAAFKGRAPLIAGFTLLVLIAAAMAWLVVSGARQSAIVFRAFQIQAATSDVFRIVQDAETGQRGFLLTSDDKYLSPYTDAIPDFESRANALVDLAKSEPVQEADAIELRDLGRQKMSELARTVELTKVGDQNGALALVKTDLGRTLMRRIRATSEKLQTTQTRVLNSEYETAQTIGRVLLVASVVALVLVAVMAALAVTAFNRYARLLEENEARVRQANETLEQTVEERTAELRESNDEIQRYAYIVSHDLRAPLVNVMGFTSELEALRDDLIGVGAKPEDDPARKTVITDFDESIGFIKAAINKMEGLIAAILRLSREGRRVFNAERLDMTELVQGLADAQRHQAEAAGAEVVVADNLPMLEADRVAIEQIFGNLIDNAIKYLDRSRPGRIEVKGERLGKRLRFDVSDNGRGIDPQDHKRVFELFRRAGAQDRPGDGIGLAHVQTLVRSLGGRIDLESQPGKGTTFRVLLPPVQRRLTV